MILVFVGDLSFVWGSMFFLLVKFCQILTWDIWFRPVQVFCMEKISQIRHILKEENSETPKFYEVAKIIEGF
jgi:hypothetical protein